MTAVNVLKEVVGGVAKSAGYKGSFPTWRKSSDLGDVAVIDVQRSPWSAEGTQRFAINIAVAPRPWMDWLAHVQGRSTPKLPPESFGLYRSRVRPRGGTAGEGEWWVLAEDEGASTAVADLRQRLESEVIPELDILLDRDALVDRVRSGDSFGDMRRSQFPQFFARAEALLLADMGRGQEMAAALQDARKFTSDTPESFVRRAPEFEEFVRSRASNR